MVRPKLNFVRETKNKHTSDFLQKLVPDVLKEFEVWKKQVLCAITGDASNISTTEKLNEQK